MPIYEYQCLQCGKRSELLQRMSNPPLAACPECGGPVKKLISSPAFQFKGSGWYATDYGGKGGGKDKSDSKSGESGGGESKGGESKSGESKGGESKGGESKSTESKPETKPAAKSND